MKININKKSVNYIAVYMTMFYSFVTRSILATFVFHNMVMILVVYGIIYIGLICAFLKSFDRKFGHLYAPKGLFSLLLLAIIMIFEMSVSDSLSSMRYYSMALLLPLTMLPEMKESKTGSIVFAVIGVFFSFGCFLNYFFLPVYRVSIKPLFSTNALESINATEKLTGSSIFAAGFTSQVGYTSFFLIVCIGAVFCFRKTVFKYASYPLLLFMIGALLLTGKRGPVAFFVVALMFVYFMEGYGKEKIYRVFQIVGILVALIIILTLLNKFTDSDGIKRIYETFEKLLHSGSIDDAGRTQLHEQALWYFGKNPIFGIGWTNFMKMFTLRSTHVHCIYLQLLCETGVVGFAIFIGFFVKRFISTLNQARAVSPSKDSLDSCWIRFSLYVQAYFLMYGITGNPLYDVEETIIYFFAIGISYLPLLGES